MSNYTCSVIMPMLPAGMHVKKAIESVQSQTYPVKLAVSNPRCRMRYAQNVNRAVRMEPEVDYYFRMDSDDILEPNCIERLMEEIGDYDAIVPDLQKFGTDSGILTSEENVTVERLLEVNPMVTFCLVKRTVWDTLGGYDEELSPRDVWAGYEDWDFWIKFVKAGFRYKVLKEPLYNYRMHGDKYGDIANLRRDELHNILVNKHR